MASRCMHGALPVGTLVLGLPLGHQLFVGAFCGSGFSRDWHPTVWHRSRGSSRSHKHRSVGDDKPPSFALSEVKACCLDSLALHTWCSTCGDPGLWFTAGPPAFCGSGFSRDRLGRYGHLIAPVAAEAAPTEATPIVKMDGKPAPSERQLLPQAQAGWRWQTTAVRPERSRRLASAALPPDSCSRKAHPPGAVRKAVCSR